MELCPYQKAQGSLLVLFWLFFYVKTLQEGIVLEEEMKPLPDTKYADASTSQPLEQ